MLLLKNATKLNVGAILRMRKVPVTPGLQARKEPKSRTPTSLKWLRLAGEAGRDVHDSLHSMDTKGKKQGFKCRFFDVAFHHCPDCTWYFTMFSVSYISNGTSSK